MALATRRACASSRARSTVTSISVVAPSPSRAICRVRERATACSAASKPAGSTRPAAPLAMMAAVSLVDVSVSMLSALNVRSMTRRKVASSGPGSTAASVRKRVMRVAMSGSIIPTPLAMPTTRAGPAAALGHLGDGVRRHDGREPRRARPDQGTAAPASRGAPGLAPSGRAGRSPRSMRPARRPGRHREHGRRRAASSAASASPTGPLATLAFFETTTKACNRPSAMCRRLSVTLGPANRDRVKTAAAEHGASAASTRKSSVSSLMPMLATWERKPAGRATAPGSMARACQADHPPAEPSGHGRPRQADQRDLARDRRTGETQPRQKSRERLPTAEDRRPAGPSAPNRRVRRRVRSEGRCGGRRRRRRRCSGTCRARRRRGPPSGRRTTRAGRR